MRCWPNQCGNKISCFECGLHRTAFFEHGGKPQRAKGRLPSLWSAKRRAPDAYPAEASAADLGFVRAHSGKPS
jgi:hypothetical protein